MAREKEEGFADTIVAIATAPGKSGVAVVRVSGPDAFVLAEKLTRRPVTPGRISYRKLFHPQLLTSRFSLLASTLDDALVLSFASPHSYTGEDVVEFQCHGGSVTPRRVLEACFAAGARLARRGEFTERAFLNGKMDLSEAEAVIDLVDAKTEAAADDALAHLGGEAKRRYRELYDSAVDLSSQLEHSLDVDDSDLSEEFLTRLNSQLSTLNAQLLKAIDDAKRSALLKDGALVVLAGPPNAGKSSLLNALVGESRAIVSEVPGTTRDSIEVTIDFGGIPVRLVDTAGLRESRDEIEGEGIRRAEALIADADLVLGLDCDRGIRVHSKCDLSRGEGINVSAKTGEGLEGLRKLLIARLSDLQPRQNSRALNLLLEAATQLSTLNPQPSTFDAVLAANAVRSASEALGKLVGATYSDDLLDALFSRFCVGK